MSRNGQFMLLSSLCKQDEAMQSTNSVTLVARLLYSPITNSQATSVPMLAELATRDAQVEAFVSASAAELLGVVSGQWVTVSGVDGKHARQVRLMLVRQAWHKRTGSLLNDPLSTLENSENEESSKVMLLSPMTLFSLGVNPGQPVIVRKATNDSSDILNTPVRYKDSHPPIATHVTVARVRAPNSSGHAEYGPALRKYFCIPRVVALHDVISVEVPLQMKLAGESEDMNGVEQAESASGEGDDSIPGLVGENKEMDIVSASEFDFLGKPIPRPTFLVHFQVTSLEGASESRSAETGMLVDGVGGSTMLTQAGAVNAHVPDESIVKMFLRGEANLREESSESVIRKQSPPILQHQVLLQMEKLLLPLFHPQSAGVIQGTSILLQGARGTGKRMIVRELSKRFGVHVKEVSLTPLRGLPDDRAAKKLSGILSDAMSVGPCILHLRQLAALAPLAQGAGAPEDPNQVVAILKQQIRKQASCKTEQGSSCPVAIIASTSVVEDVPALLRGCFSHECTLSVPSLSQRKDLLSSIVGESVDKKEDGVDQNSVQLRKLQLSDDVSIQTLATKTAGRTALELKVLFANAGSIAVKRVMKDLRNNVDVPSKVSICMDDIETAIDQLPSTAMDIGAPKIPQVLWDDVGGLGHAKDEILDMVELPLKHPELFVSGVRQRSGILLYGPPGTGKTLLAKAVATECAMNFISVKGPELLDMYIGESERKVRQVFETARNASPCVLFFDELDSLAPQRGRGADSGGVMDRVVSQLLTELDGMQGNTNVFVIGATNRPDLLDQSLLRPGRFDRLIYLGISSDRSAQKKIVKALSRKYNLDENVDFDILLEKCPLTFTGADFFALCSGAMSNALKRRVIELQNELAAINEAIDPQGNQVPVTIRKHLNSLSDDELTVKVEMQDYELALSTTIPSVSQDELRHYESLKEKFSAGTPQQQKHSQSEATNDDVSSTTVKPEVE